MNADLGHQMEEEGSLSPFCEGNGVNADLGH